jgi:predicted patatin/cPLA2 family phospholipase
MAAMAPHLPEPTGKTYGGSRPHPVLELIRTRAESGSRPGHRTDRAVLGLAFEGGGMRGIASAGMGLALVQLGLTSVFDYVYGSSAGAFNGAYFVSGQGAFGISIYYDDINNARFINPWRLLTKRHVVNLEQLFGVAMTTSKPLDYASLQESPIKFRVLASNLTKRRSVVFDHFESREDLFKKLRASAAMPYLAGPPIQIGADLYSDASLYESIPFRSATNGSVVSEPCTHMLILRSRPAGIQRTAPSFLERQLIGKPLRAYGNELYSDFLNRANSYAEDLAILRKKSESPDQEPHLLDVAIPQGTATLGQLERERPKLVDAAAAGMAAMVTLLTGAAPIVREAITAFKADGRPVQWP